MRAVCVFCSSSLTIDQRYLRLARDVGGAIARRGWSVVSGGGSISMMGELGRSARAAGGHTIGVIPDALVAMDVADHDADELVVTRDMRQRKGIMDERSDAFLALPGGIGTLEELVEAWTARSLNMHHKPVVVLDPWGDFALLRELVESWKQRGFVKQPAIDHVHWATDIESALDQVAVALSGIRDGMAP